MANRYRKLTAGAVPSDISITAYNRMIDMLNWWQSNQARSGGRPLRGLVDWDQAVFKTKNSSGADLPTYGVLGLSSPLYGPDDNLAEFKNVTPLEGVEPSVAAHAGGKWGVLLEMTANGAIGRCCFSGVVPTKIYVNGADDTHCDVIAAETVDTETVYLGTGASGAKILWRENEGDGEETIVWAIVRLGDRPELLVGFELKDVLTPGGSATAYRLRYDGVDSYDRISDGEGGYEEIEVYDSPAFRRGRAATESLVGSSGFAQYIEESGRYEIVVMQPHALWLLAQASYAAGPSDAIQLMNHVICQPTGGLLDSFPSNAVNLFSQTIAADDWVLVFWNEYATAWGAFRAGGANALKHGKVYGAFTNVVGTVKNAVSVQACDADGNNVVAGAFTVYTPINPDAWTNLKENDVVGYVTDAEGVNIIVTDCWEPDREFLGILYVDLAADDASTNVLPTIRVVGRMPAGSTLVSNTLKLSAVSGDTVVVRRKYSTQGGDDAAGAWFIAAVKGVGGEVTADETWIHAEQNGNDVEISHLSPDAVDPVNGIATAAELTIVGQTLSLTRPFQEFDEKGHRVDEDTMSDSEVTVPDEKVKASSADPTAGYLDEKLEGDTFWIGTPTYDGVNHKVKIEHIASGIAYGAAVPAAILTASGTSTEITVTPKDIQLDACRHVVSMNAGTPVSWDLADHLAGSQWITLTPAAGVITIEHADAYTVTQEGASPTIDRSGQTVTVSFAVPQFDAKGHYKQDDGTPETDTFTLPIIDVSGDGTWTSVSITAGDATVSHIRLGSTDSTTTQDALSLNEDSDPVIRLTTKRLNVDANGHIVSETSAVTSDLTLVEVTWYEWDITGGNIKKRLHTAWVPKHTVGSWTNVFTYGECS